MSSRDLPHVVLAEEVDQGGPFLFAVYGTFPDQRAALAFVQERELIELKRRETVRFSCVPLWPPEEAARDFPGE